MASQVQDSVVIPHQHALRGEGITKHLRARLGVEAMIASGNDPEAVTSALALGPAVVIFEMGDTFRQVDLTTLAPRAILIDVSTVMTRGHGRLIRGCGDGEDPSGGPHLHEFR